MIESCALTLAQSVDDGLRPAIHSATLVAGVDGGRGAGAEMAYGRRKLGGEHPVLELPRIARAPSIKLAAPA